MGASVSGAAPFRPLEGVRVLDLATLVAGEYAARILLELGADVVKCESPAPAGARRLSGSDGRYAHLHDYANAGKQSISVDPDHSASAPVLEDLGRWADVVVASTEDGGSERVADLMRLNSRLVGCVVSELGPGFPAPVSSASPATTDAIVQALAGTAFVTGEPDGPPYIAGSGFTITTTGVHLCIAVLKALIDRQRTDTGQLVEVSMVDTALALDAEHAPLVVTEHGRYQAARTGHYGDVDTLAVYRGTDGYITIEVWGEGPSSVWGRLAKAMGRQDLITDPKFVGDQARMAHWPDLHAIVEGWMRTFPSALACVEHLIDAGVVAGLVMEPAAAIESAQVRARQLIRDRDPEMSARLTSATPYLFNGRRSPNAVSAPALGADTESILLRLGYSEDRIRELFHAGALPAPTSGDAL